MAAYVHDQGIINERRMKEMENQMKANEATSVSAPVTAETNNSSSITIESSSSSTTPAMNPSGIQNQSQSQTLVAWDLLISIGF